MPKKIKCIEHDSRPIGQPKEGFFWICADCFADKDALAWIGQNILDYVEKHGSIPNEEIVKIKDIAFKERDRLKERLATYSSPYIIKGG